MTKHDPASLFNSEMEAVEIHATCAEYGEVSLDVLRSDPCPYCPKVESAVQL